MPGEEENKNKPPKRKFPWMRNRAEKAAADAERVRQELNSGKKGGRIRHFWLIGSFRASTVLSFMVISIITASLIVGMMMLVFDSYFRAYSLSNTEVVSTYLASRVGMEFDKTKSFDGINFEALESDLQASGEIGVVVTGSDGITYYDSRPETSAGSGVKNSEGAMQISMAAVPANGVTVGEAQIWVYSPASFLGSLDLKFRNDAFQAMIVAAFASVLIATAIGLLIAHILISPINRISLTARRISAGDLTARTNLVGANEMGRLGESFDAMAESIERDRNMEMQLTSDVAHELRTPLMAIQATVEAMLDGVYDVTRERLELVDSEVQRLSRLVDALLKLSRLERRSQPLEEQVCDVASIAEAVVESNKMLALDSGLRLDLHVVQDSKVYCDNDMIRQAVANLISNSVRYTPKGGSIDVYVRRDGDYAAIDVSDTGIGLTPEEEKKVFSRFWRSDASRAQETGGLGVGLAVVKEIVSRHHGQVSVHGDLGRGTTFTIYLPVYKPRNASAETESK